MKINYHYPILEEFHFWAGAKENASKLSISEMRKIESVLEDMFPDGILDIALNNIFWLEFESICALIDLDADEVQSR